MHFHSIFFFICVSPLKGFLISYVWIVSPSWSVSTVFQFVALHPLGIVCSALSGHTSYLKNLTKCDLEILVLVVSQGSPASDLSGDPLRRYLSLKIQATSQWGVLRTLLAWCCHISVGNTRVCRDSKAFKTIYKEKIMIRKVGRKQEIQNCSWSIASRFKYSFHTSCIIYH